MATTEEIERRVEEVDAARSARRSAAAKLVGDLAQRRTVAAEQLSEIERELGDVLADSSDVMEIDELARFIGVPAADLSRWLNGRRTHRGKRNRSVGSAPTAKNAANPESSTDLTLTAGNTGTSQESVVRGDSGTNMLAQVAAGVR